MSTWIDFKELRSKLSFEPVLRHFAVEIKEKNGQHMGFCPLPSHNGKRKSVSFSANLEKGIFHCFGCQAKGNVLDFAAIMQGVSPKDGPAFRKVAIELRDRFCPDLGAQPKNGEARPEKRKPVEKEKKPDTPELDLEPRIVTNAPLDFELKDLDTAHPYLDERGFTPETSRTFGIGFCSRGSLAGRIAIPLHDQAGKLIGYAGRVVDDEAITEENPRYRLPSRRERNGTVFEFKKTTFLYNGHRLESGSDDIVVVEGFPSVWWLTQCGHPRVVATMGADCSVEQSSLLIELVGHDGNVVVMSDGDDAGDKFAHSVFELVAPHRFVRWAKLGKGEQPTDLSADELTACLTL